MKDFKYVLDKYMQNPSCPATILIPGIRGTSPARSRRRSLVAKAYEHDVFRRNDRDCTMYDWYLLLNFLKLMMSRGESGMDPVANYYEDEFVDSFDTELSHDSLMDYFYDYPDIDQHAHLEMMLLSPVEAAESMRNMRNSGTALCEVPTSRMRISSNSTMRGNSSSNDKTAWWLNSTESRTRNAPRVQLLVRDEDPGEVDKRLIFVPGMRTTHYHGIPDLGRIFQGIEDGDLTLHYARYQYYNNQPPGPFLELAYWIGPNPGT
jgi:chitinase